MSKPLQLDSVKYMLSKFRHKRWKRRALFALGDVERIGRLVEQGKIEVMEATDNAVKIRHLCCFECGKTILEYNAKRQNFNGTLHCPECVAIFKSQFRIVEKVETGMLGVLQYSDGTIAVSEDVDSVEIDFTGHSGRYSLKRINDCLERMRMEVPND